MFIKAWAVKASTGRGNFRVERLLRIWLINHGVSRHKAEKKPTKLFWAVEVGKVSNERKALLDHGQKGILAHEPNSRLEPVCRPRIPRVEGWLDYPEKKNLIKDPRALLLVFLQSFRRSTLWPLTRVTGHLGKWNNQTFWGLLGIGSKLMLIPGDPKKHYGLPFKVGSYGGQVISGVLAEIQLTIGPVGLWTHPVVISQSQNV